MAGQKWYFIMYSTYNKGKSVFAERFIKKLKATAFKRNDS